MNDEKERKRILGEVDSNCRPTGLLNAQSMVIVGASPNPVRVGGIPVQTMKAFGTGDRVLLVNKKYSEVEGYRCYPNISSLPWVPDLAVLAVPAPEVLTTLLEAREAGIHSAVVFAAGFAESGSPIGVGLQQALVQFARECGMQIAGPNCMGFANLQGKVFANFIQHRNFSGPAGPLAIVSQSGNMMFAFMRAAGPAPTGFSFVVSTGNEACFEFSQYLEHLAASPETEAVVGYLEQVRDGDRFLRVAARLRDIGKPLFLLKAGNSKKGAEASASHTAAMSGDAEVYGAAFRQLGVMTASEPLRLMDLVRLWQTRRQPSGTRVGVFSLSGAGCIVLADLFDAAGGHLPTFSAEVQGKLREVIPSYGMVANPVDLTGNITNDPSFFQKALDAVVTSDEVDVVVIFVTGYYLELFADRLIETAGRTDKLIVSVDVGVSATHGTLEKCGVPVFSDLNRAVGAIVEYVRWSSAGRISTWRPPDHLKDKSKVAADLEMAANSHQSMDEFVGKRFLANCGLPIVPEAVARNADEAVELANSLGMPVAVKILSRDIAHKTDVGGVRLNLSSAQQVRDAFESVMTNARTAMPEAAIDGAVVQRQITDAVPILVGVTRDAVFGPVMTVGLGGVLTEIYKDVSRRLLPIDHGLALEMIDELKAVSLLKGFRGSPSADIAALADVMTKLSGTYLQCGESIADIELNPVLVQRSGAVAVDCLITLRP